MIVAPRIGVDDFPRVVVISDDQTHVLADPGFWRRRVSRARGSWNEPAWLGCEKDVLFARIAVGERDVLFRYDAQLNAPEYWNSLRNVIDNNAPEIIDRLRSLYGNSKGVAVHLAKCSIRLE